MDGDLSLRRHVALLGRGLRTIVLFVVLGVAAAVAVNQFATKVYEARAQLLVGPVLIEAQPDINELLAAQRLAQTYAELATTTSFLERVRTDLQLDESLEDLRRHLVAIAPPESLFIQIAFQHEDPEIAAQVAQGIATALVDAAPVAVADPEEPEGVKQIEIVSNATPPEDPVSPRWVLNLGAGLVTGLLGGVVLVYVRGLIRDELDDVQEAEELAGVPILGAIGSDGLTGEPVDAVALARLVKRLELIDEGPSRLVLTSAGDVQCGWAAEEIAAHFGSLGRPTLLLRVDSRATARSTRATSSFERLLAAGSVRGTLRTDESPHPNVRVLDGGPGVEAAAVAATSDRVSHAVGMLSEAVDNVVIAGDSPTVSVATLVLAKEATAILLVVDPRISHRRDITGAVAALRSVGARLVGIAVVGTRGIGNPPTRDAVANPAFATSSTDGAPTG